MTKYFCDVCGKELPQVQKVLERESDKLCFEIKIGEKTVGDVDWGCGDFCYDCIVKAVKTLFAKNATKKRGKK